MYLEYVSFCRITFVNSLEASLRKQQDLFLSRITAPDSRTSYPRAKWATITSSSLELLAFLIKAIKSRTIKQHSVTVIVPCSGLWISLLVGDTLGLLGRNSSPQPLRSPGASTSQAAISFKSPGSSRSKAHAQGTHPQGDCPHRAALRHSSAFLCVRLREASCRPTEQDSRRPICAGRPSRCLLPLEKKKTNNSIFIQEHVHREVAP